MSPSMSPNVSPTCTSGTHGHTLSVTPPLPPLSSMILTTALWVFRWCLDMLGGVVGKRTRRGSKVRREGFFLLCLLRLSVFFWEERAATSAISFSVRVHKRRRLGPTSASLGDKIFRVKNRPTHGQSVQLRNAESTPWNRGFFQKAANECWNRQTCMSGASRGLWTCTRRACHPETRLNQPPSVKGTSQDKSFFLATRVRILLRRGEHQNDEYKSYMTPTVV